jgi:formate hydrogenlyase subunit 4
MSDAPLHRTLRRCTAVLLIPLSLLLYVYARQTVNRFRSLLDVLTLADLIALFVFLGAVAYLAGSVFVQLTGTRDTD